jgi:hypothetical protein
VCLASRRLIKSSVDLETQLSEESAADETMSGPCRVGLARAVPVRDEIGNAIKLLKKSRPRWRSGQLIRPLPEP